jgi:hypothetical protein
VGEKAGVGENLGVIEGKRHIPEVGEPGSLSGVIGSDR